MNRIVIVAALLACAACTQTSTSSSSASASAATLQPPAAATSGTPAVASPAAPADASGAEAFLREALRAYASPATAPGAEPSPPPANESTAQFAEREARENAQLYTPELVDLMRRDRLSTNEGEVGVLDWVPLCECQDDAGLRLQRIETAPGPDGQVLATATFSTEDPNNPRHIILYTLQRIAEGWRISDVEDRSPGAIAGGVLAHLREGVPEQERAFRAAPQVRPARAGRAGR